MYQLPIVANVQGLSHGFSTRADGNQRHGLGEPAWKVSEHRDLFLRRVSMAEFPLRFAVEMAALRPGFEETIVVVDATDAGRGMTSTNNNAVPCEAMVTSTPSLTLFLTVGDCIPVVLFDPHKRVLALVHGGRESTVRKLPEKTLSVMRKKFRTDPADVIVGMGPGFRSHSVKRLPAGISDPIWNAHIRKNGHETFLMDLFGYSRDRLVASGVPDKNIDECPYDTYVRADLFFSHRRSAETGEKEGRHACAVGMVG